MGELLAVPFGLASVQLATALLANPQGPQGIFAAESGAMYDFVEVDRAVGRFEGEFAFPDIKGSTYDTRTCARDDGTPCQMFDWEDYKEEGDASRCSCQVTERQRVEVFANNASLETGATCAFNNTVCFVKSAESAFENDMGNVVLKREFEKRERFRDLKLLAPDCSLVRGPVQLIKMLMNSTGRRFDCVDMSRLKVDSHAALDDEIYSGFGDSPGHTSTVQGVVHGFDFKDTASGDALRLTLMHNISGLTEDFFGIQLKWRPWQTRILTTINQVGGGVTPGWYLSKFESENHSLWSQWWLLIIRTRCRWCGASWRRHMESRRLRASCSLASSPTRRCLLIADYC